MHEKNAIENMSDMQIRSVFTGIIKQWTLFRKNLKSGLALMVHFVAAEVRCSG